METAEIIEVLRSQDYITEDDARDALAYAEAGKGDAINYLIENNIISQASLGNALAEHYQTVYTDLEARSPSEHDLARIPEELARTMRVIFVDERGDDIRVATDKVDQPELAKALAEVFPNKTVKVTYSFTDQIDGLLRHYQKNLTTRFAEIVKHDRKVAPELFDEIIKDALTYRASDVHFEPTVEETRIRFRIDGMLRRAGTISPEHYEGVLNRMKILSNLRTDEHFTPQDGAIRFSTKGTTVDLRLSVVPTLAGEKAVIRILTEYVRGLSFEALGFSDQHVEVIDRASKKPFGMILTVGPTGSGKTTTLYALIRKLITPELNVMTIEDPVEYRMTDANQIQVNQKTGLTFAKGLRAIVRQDPNVILVGEIRDTETAETAVNAALTGHLLLSTFHANNASTAIPRLLEMGVEPFLLSSTLELVVAQRLARRICETCRESYQTDVKELSKTFPSAATYLPKGPITLYRGTGCPTCNGTGYRGRVSIVEMIAITPKIKTMIEARPSATDVARVAAEEGNISLFADGLEKAQRGVTTIEEVLRVAAPSM